VAQGVVLYPVVAPALILVGTLMMRSAPRRLGRPRRRRAGVPHDVIMPLAVSITEGIAFGLVAAALLKVATGRGASCTGSSTCSPRCSS